jgi:hypothetical protein
MPRKPKGYKSRYEIIYRQTELPNGQKKDRYHVIKHNKDGITVSYGYIGHCPGPDASNERILACARSTSVGLHHVTVPVYIIRDAADKEAMAAGTLDPVLYGNDEKTGEQRASREREHKESTMDKNNTTELQFGFVCPDYLYNHWKRTECDIVPTTDGHHVVLDHSIQSVVYRAKTYAECKAFLGNDWQEDPRNADPCGGWIL